MGSVGENINNRVVLMRRPGNLRHHFGNAVHEFCTKDDICELILLSTAEKEKVLALYAHVLSQNTGAALSGKVYEKSLEALKKYLLKAQLKLEQRHTPENIRRTWHEDLIKLVDALVYLGEVKHRAGPRAAY